METTLTLTLTTEQMELLQSCVLRTMQQNNRVFGQVTDCRIHVILKSENQKLKKLHDNIITSGIRD